MAAKSLGLRDRLNAFLDMADVPVESAKAGPLAGLTLGVKDIFDVKGHVSGWGNPDRFEEGKVGSRDGAGGAKAARRRCALHRQDADRGARLLDDRPKRAFCASGQSEGPGQGDRRLVVGLGGGGRGRAGRHRHGIGHRRLGARAGELLRADRPEDHARGDLARRHDAAGAVLRHVRVVRQGCSDLREGRRGDVRRNDPSPSRAKGALDTSPPEEGQRTGVAPDLHRTARRTGRWTGGGQGIRADAARRRRSARFGQGRQAAALFHRRALLDDAQAAGLRGLGRAWRMDLGDMAGGSAGRSTTALPSARR